MLEDVDAVSEQQRRELNRRDSWRRARLRPWALQQRLARVDRR